MHKPQNVYLRVHCVAFNICSLIWSVLSLSLSRRLGCTRWFKYDRDKLWLVYTQIVPVIFEPPCMYWTLAVTSYQSNVLVPPAMTLRNYSFTQSAFMTFACLFTVCTDYFSKRNSSAGFYSGYCVCSLASESSCRFLTSRALVRARARPCRIYDGQNSSGTGLLEYFRFSLSM